MFVLAVVGWLVTTALAFWLAALALMCLWLRLVFGREPGLNFFIVVPALLSAALFYYSYVGAPVALTWSTAP